MSVVCASHPVLGIATDQRQQPHDDIRPTRYQRMRPAKWGHDRLPHLEAMVRHRAYVGCPSIEDNRRVASFSADHRRSLGRPLPTDDPEADTKARGFLIRMLGPAGN
jgi:hypothetical protein